MSDEITIATSNVTLALMKRNNNKDEKSAKRKTIEETTMKDLMKEISDFMADDKIERRKVSKLPSMIRLKLEFRCHNNLECVNEKLTQWVLELNRT